MNALLFSPSEWASQVRDSDCDAGCVMYYANYSFYMNDARSALLQEAGVDFALLDRHSLSLMVDEESVRYVKPLRQRERFSVLTSIVSRGTRTVTLAHQVIEKSDKRLCAESTVVLRLALDNAFDFQLSSDLAEIVACSGLGAVLTPRSDT